MNQRNNIPLPQQPPPSAPAAGTAYGVPPSPDAATPLDVLTMGGTEKQFDPWQLLAYVVRYRVLIAVVVLLGVLGGFLNYLTKTPMYRAEALMEIMPPSSSIIKELRVIDETSDIRTLKTALTKLKSRELLRRVVHELGLAEKDDFLFPKRPFSLSTLKERILGRLELGAKAPERPQLTLEQRTAIAVGILQAGLQTRLVNQTRIVAISFSHANPEYAWRVPNQVANSYISFRLDRASEATLLARQLLSDRVEEVKRKLAEAERKLVAYAKQAGITLSSGEQEGSLLVDNIKALNEALSEAIRERLKLERLVKQIDAGKAMQLPEVIESEAIQGYRQKIVQLRAEYRQKLRLFKPDYPEMRELQAQIRELQRLMREDVRAIAGSIRLKYKVAIQREQDLRDKLKELEAQHVRLRDKNIQYTILKREVDSLRTQYQSLIEKLNKLDVAAEVKNKTAAIVQYAVRPGAPYAPNLKRHLLLGLLIGIAVAAGLVYVLEQFNSTYAAPDQLEEDLKLPVLGVVPKLREDKLAEALNDPRSAFSEAIYTLRTALQFTGVNSAPRSLVITSSEASEGKSTIVRKLAEAFGALGMTVLVIDADMRRPTQHRHAGLPNTIGLSNLLTNTVPVGQADPETEVMRNTPWKNVWLITAGTLPPNPPNLLASQKMASLVEAATRRFDIVIIDSPPVLGFADALLLARLAEATLLVVAARQATRKAVQGALKRLQTAGGQVVGSVFNRFAVDSLEYRYAYRYSQYGYYSADGYLSYGDTDSGSTGQQVAQAAERESGAGGAIARLFRRRAADRDERPVQSHTDEPPPPGAADQSAEQGGGDRPVA